MAKTFRAGVIGCGAISEFLHVPDYAVSSDAELVALCDVDKEKARRLAERFAPEARVYTDYRKMLREAALDGVTVTLPNHLHAEVTTAALRSGCHVLVEKPMATSLAEARQMIAAARKARRLLMVNQSQRRFAVHRKAKEVIDSGILGRILHVTAMFGHEGPEHWSPSGKWFFRRKQARFGAMADLGVHKADLVRYLTGKEVASISAYTARLEKRNADVDDNFVSCLTFTDGTVGTLCASWTVKGMNANYMILHCANGTLQIGVQENRPLLAQLVRPECEIAFDIPKPLNNYPGTWGLDVSGAFARAARGLEPPFCTGEDGLKALAIVLAAEKSHQTRRAVKLAG